MLVKLDRTVDGIDVPEDYGNIFFEEPSGNHRRLTIGPSAGHTKLLLELAALFPGPPWCLLYVLVMPRKRHREPGRYQSQFFDSLEELGSFIAEFEEFFDSDGRHHVWIGNPKSDALVVYDQHNVIFAYGPLERFRALLMDRGFEERSFWFSNPHSHHYWPENDEAEERLMAKTDWQFFPLSGNDEWK